MATSDSRRLLVRWITRDKSKIEAIRNRFGIPRYTTVNGFSPATIRDCDMPLLQETARRGYIDIVDRRWAAAGNTMQILDN